MKIRSFSVIFKVLKYTKRVSYCALKGDLDKEDLEINNFRGRTDRND